MKKRVSLVGLITFFMFSAVARADQVSLAATVFTATLNGSQEVPPNGSIGIGVALVQLSPTLINVTVAYVGFGFPPIASDIHCCAPPGGNAIVAITLTFFPVNLSGTYERVFDWTVVSTYNPDFIAAHGGTVSGAMAAFLEGLNTGQAYLDIHTSQFPGGEIRGQLEPLEPVPEPSSMFLLSSGLVGAFVLLKRKRKRARIRH